MKTLLLRALAAAALAFAAQSAFAIPITAGSQISTGGTLFVIGGDGSVANATGIDFAAPGAPDPSVDGALTGYSGTGALASFVCLPGALCGSISDILSFAAFAGDSPFLIGAATGTSPGFSFSLNAPLTVTRVPGTPSAAAALILSGSGIFTTSGFDATNALFTLVTLNNTDGPTTYSATIFALGTVAPDNPVPEPGSVVLLGLGFAGLLVARRKSAA